MPTRVSKGQEIFREEELLGLLYRTIRYGYNKYLRPLLPRWIALYNGILVQAARLGDSIVPWQDNDIPGYEHALVRAIRNQVQMDDTVVIVGGGWGVSSVAAAEEVDEDGAVIVFEAAKSAVQDVSVTNEINEVESIVTARHCVVAEDSSIRSDKKGADRIHPTKLPAGDVLVLDCEGAERTILKEMDIQPRTVIVETHGVYGAPTAVVEEQLIARGYEVIDRDVAEQRYRDKCIKNDIHVLAASHDFEPLDHSWDIIRIRLSACSWTLHGNPVR